MVVQITKSTVVENIYKNFFDILDGNSNLSGTIYPAFPDINIDNKSDYPISILDSPEISTEKHTLGKSVVSGTITFDIHTTSAKTADQYGSDALNEIETSKGTLADQGLRMVFLDSADKDVIVRGDIRIHIKSITWRFMFYFSKTSAY